MSENRCPMCGKVNPGDLDVCQYCQARLTPLIFSDSPNESEGYSQDSADLSENGSLSDKDNLEKDENNPINDKSIQKDWLDKIRDESAYNDDASSMEETGDLFGEEETIADGEDWLERIRALHRADQQRESEDDQKPLYEDLSEFDSDEALEKEEDEEEDWQKIFHAGKDLTETGEGEEEIEAEDPLPEWLREGFDSESEDFLSSPPSDDEVSEWLQDRDDTPVPDENERLDDWISAENGKDKASADQKGKDLPTNKQEIPNWLRDLDEIPPEIIEDELKEEQPVPTVSPILDEDLDQEELFDEDKIPDWLSPGRDIEDLGIVEEGDLAPAEIPGWLAAIRPVNGEDTKEQDDRSGVEITGPLVGLQGVLPVESEVTPSKSPPAYSARLRITETQQTHIDIIRKMLTDEGKPDLIPSASTLTAQNAFRWLIGFLLILGISLIILFDSDFFPLPNINNIPLDILETNRIISTLPDQKPALISFDYEPESSGEMHAVAAPLIDHLMMRGFKLALVSTKSTGPAMGNDFIQKTQSDHNYLSGEDYINLGFIPGGASGLLSFSQTPRLVLQQSIDGGNPWETSTLREINSLSDFAAIVIITENAEIARTWIEQVQPRLMDTPLFMVVSAQIEPVIRPYAGAGPDVQVAGIISGINGGVAYELVIGKENLNGEYWDAFNIGLMIVLLVIFIGGAVQISRYVKASDNPSDQGGSR